MVKARREVLVVSGVRRQGFWRATDEITQGGHFVSLVPRRCTARCRNTDEVNSILQMHFVKPVEFLRICTEMAFEDRAYCLLSHDGPHCSLSRLLHAILLPAWLLGQFSLWTLFIYILITHFITWFQIQIQLFTPGVAYHAGTDGWGLSPFFRSCKMSDVYFSSLKSPRLLLECSWELLSILLFGEHLRLFTQEANLSSLSPVCLWLFLYVMISSVYFLTETI